MFESGNRVQDTLADLADIMGGRDAAICRELTKLHEEITRAPIAELAKAADYAGNARRIRAGDRPAAARDAGDDRSTTSTICCAASLARDSVKDAVAHAVELSGRPRREVYARALELAKETTRRRWRRLTAPRRPTRSAKLASPARVAAFRTGLSAESRAAAFLMAKGYRILAKRFRTPYGEIDLVAKKRNLLAFIEVKARASLDDAAYAVTPRQQARIIDAAQAWLMAHPEHAEFELRFDAMLIAPRRLPRHLLAAFDAST